MRFSRRSRPADSGIWLPHCASAVDAMREFLRGSRTRDAGMGHEPLSTAARSECKRDPSRADRYAACRVRGPGADRVAADS